MVLFLDELILWLASHSQDQGFLNREGQKVFKLVDAGEAGRSFVLLHIGHPALLSCAG